MPSAHPNFPATPIAMASKHIGALGLRCRRKPASVHIRCCGARACLELRHERHSPQTDLACHTASSGAGRKPPHQTTAAERSGKAWECRFESQWCFKGLRWRTTSHSDLRRSGASGRVDTFRLGGATGRGPRH